MWKMQDGIFPLEDSRELYRTPSQDCSEYFRQKFWLLLEKKKTEKKRFSGKIQHNIGNIQDVGDFPSRILGYLI